MTEESVQVTDQKNPVLPSVLPSEACVLSFIWCQHQHLAQKNLNTLMSEPFMSGCKDTQTGNHHFIPPTLYLFSHSNDFWLSGMRNCHGFSCNGQFSPQPLMQSRLTCSAAFRVQFTCQSLSSASAFSFLSTVFCPEISHCRG